MKRRDQVTVDRAAALGGIDVVRARFRGLATRPHSHPEYEIGVVRAGRRMVRWRGRELQVGEGTVIVFRPDEVHAGAPLDAEGSTYCAFLIAPDLVEPIAGWQSATGARDSLPSAQGPVIHDLGLARLLLAAHADLASDPVCNAGDRLRDALAALGPWLHRPADRQGRSVEHTAVGEVRRYLEAHYRTRIRLATLAQLTGLSTFHLIRVFREATGVPPYAYLEQIRVNRAAALLRSGCPVSSVAFQTGFADQSHLTRFFKRFVGVTPGRYQRSALLAAGRGDRAAS
ncbi:MAG: helix-turn-helix domain-containing protein [Gemmatimonadales bacterium]